MSKVPAPRTPSSRADIFRQAAYLIENERGYGSSCWAISMAAAGNNFDKYARLGAHPGRYLKDAFKDLFHPGDRGTPYWMEELGDDGRVVALCFMAAMVEAGDA